MRAGVSSFTSNVNEDTVPPQAKWAYIYALKDPFTGRVRYVGKTDNPRRRLCSHLSRYCLALTTHKARWVNKIVSQGSRPVMVLLERVVASDWEKAEKRWITRLRKAGCGLTNAKDGGGGAHYSVESRRKIGEATKRWWKTLLPEERKRFIERCLAGKASMKHSEETKDKIGKANRGKTRGPRSSRYTGVSWYSFSKQWRASIGIHGRKHHLGYFDVEEDAARAYNAKARELGFLHVPPDPE